jgi:hypothetical protein
LHVCSHGLRFVRGYLKARERRQWYETLAQGQPVVMLNVVSDAGLCQTMFPMSGQTLVKGQPVVKCHENEKKYYRPLRCA